MNLGNWDPDEDEEDSFEGVTDTSTEEASLHYEMEQQIKSAEDCCSD